MKRIGLLLLLCALVVVPVLAQPALTVGIDQATREQWNSIVSQFQEEIGIKTLLHPYPANNLAQQVLLQGTIRSGKMNLVMVHKDWASGLLRYLVDLSEYEGHFLEGGISLAYMEGRPVGIWIPFAPDWFLSVLSWPDDDETAVLFLDIVGGSKGTVSTAEPSKVSPEAMIASFGTTKIARSEHNPKLDGSLEALLGAVQTTVGETIGAMAADFMTRLPAPAQAALGKLANLYGVPFNTSTSTVTVVLEPQSGRTSSASVAALSALGVSRTAIEASTSLIKVSVPLSQLSTIVSQLGGISFIRPPYTPYTLAITGEGIAAIGADAFHVAGITGSGVKVAIIDLGFAGLSQAQGRGDIPYSVQQHDLTGSGLTSGITHGTAIAEIVHEIAPGAQLHLIKIADEVDLDLAVTYCLNNGIDIINHSLGWYNTNFYDGTGTVAEIAKRSIAGGILWLNAAGNEAQSHWEGTFSDSNSDTWNDQSLTFSATSGSQVILYMTWNNWPQASSDYDLYLYDPSSNLVASSTKHQTGTEEPTESIMTTVSASGTYTVRVKGAGSKKIEIYNLYQYLAPAIAASSILAPGNVAEVVTVGAIDYAHYVSGPLEPYSSQGPTNDGRTKPDLCAPDNVTTGTSPYTSFAGTSGATPHATGAAALLLAQDPSLSESALRARLLSQTVAMGSAYLYGHGRLVLSPPSAANQPPIAAFNANPSSATVGSSISFNGSASSDPDGTIISYAWQYGDGTTGSGVSVQHTYAAAGTYTVRLTVTDNDGATGTTTHQVVISSQPNQPPTAAFNANPSSTTVGSSISFNGSASSDPDGWIVSYAWQYGDGTTGSGVSVQHTYAAVGTYTVRLTVTDNAGATDTTIRQVTVGQATPPLAIQLSLPKVSYQVGEPIVINYSTNREAYVYICDADPSGKVILLFPNYLESNNRVTAGAHSVPGGGYTLRVSAPAGSETLYAFAATSPLPNFPTSFGSGFPILSYNPSSFLSGVRQTMQAQLPAGEGAEDILSFTVVSSAPQTGTLWVTSSPQGATVTIDGGPAGTTPIQVSVTAGTHTVTLSLAGYQTVTEQVTLSAGQTAYVQVPMTPQMQNQPPVAVINLSSATPSIGETIFFDGSGSTDPDGWIVSYAWQFGDGTTGSGVTVQHAYAAVGTYTVRLTVTDNAGATDITTRQVTVGQATPPLAIQLSLPKMSYQVGEPIVINYSTNRETYVYICDADPSGKVTLLFPNYLEPNNRVPAGTHSVPSGGYTLRVSAPEGSETLYAFAATSPLPNFPTSFGSGFPILSYNPSSFLSGVRQTMQAQLPAGEGAEDILSFTVVSSAPQTGTLWVTSSPQGATVTIDGGPAGTTPIQVSVTAGTHTVTLSLAGYQTVTEQVTLSAGQTAYVQVPMTPQMQNQPPVAVINLSSATPSIGETIFFDGSGSTDPDGWIVSYLWDFGDGTGASGVQATHAYAASGTYLVHLMVSDNQGLTHTTSRTVVISSSAPPPPWGGATGGEPPMGGTPGIFVWGTNTWHITVNAGAHWTSAHSYRLEFRTDKSFSGVNQATSGGVVPLGVIPTPTEGGKTLIFEGSLQNGSVDYTFTAPESGSIWMSLKLDIDGNGTLDESPSFVYLRTFMVHPPQVPFVVGLQKGDSGPLVPSINFRIGTALTYTTSVRFIMWLTDIATLEGS